VNPWAIRLAAHVIRAGGVVACPTEAVFGLSCDPGNTAAVRRLLALKQRSATKGLILIAADFAQLEPWLAPLSGERRQRMLAGWPGPITWVAPASPGVPTCLTGGRDSLAVRVTAHPLAAALCRACGGPLVSSSANPNRRRAARNPLEVRLRLGDNPDFILSGHTSGLDRPTEIHDLHSGQRLR